MDLVRQARDLGATALEDLSSCVRSTMQARVRRTLGIRGKPVTVCHDPQFAYLPVEGAARSIHGDLSSMMVGGVASLLLQILHPQVMAGVAQHSRFREDPLGRLSRTARFVSVTTYGSSFDAIPSIERVRAIHSTVRGVDDRGVNYRADDPHLLEWVHVTEVAMFLEGVRTFGPRDVDEIKADAYVSEMAKVASDLGVAHPPRCVAELNTALELYRPELRLSPEGREARDFVLRGVAKRPQERLVYATLVAGAVSILPQWAREQLELPATPLSSSLVARPATAALCVGIRLFAPPVPSRSGRDTESPVNRDDLAREVGRRGH